MTRVSAVSGKDSSSFRAEGFNSTAYLSTKPPVLGQVGFYFLQRNSDLSAAGLGNKTVPKILQAGSVLLQVDENRDLPALAGVTN